MNPFIAGVDVINHLVFVDMTLTGLWIARQVIAEARQAFDRIRASAATTADASNLNPFITGIDVVLEAAFIDMAITGLRIAWEGRPEAATAACRSIIATANSVGLYPLRPSPDINAELWLTDPKIACSRTRWRILANSGYALTSAGCDLNPEIAVPEIQLVAGLSNPEVAIFGACWGLFAKMSASIAA